MFLNLRGTRSDALMVKIKFQIGTNAKRTFKFDTKSIPKGEARNFTEDVLKIVADAAQAIKDRIEDYEQAAESPESEETEPKAASKPAPETQTSETQTPRTQTQEQSYTDTQTIKSPCAETLLSLDLGERDIQWVQLHESTAAVISLSQGEDQVALWRTVQDAVNPSGCYAVLIDVDTTDYLDESFRLVPETASQDRLSILRAESYAQHEQFPLPEPLIDSHFLRATQTRFGATPTASELASANLSTPADLDKYLWTWERNRFGDETVRAKANPESIFWYETDDTVLLVLPVPDGASVVRSLGFWPTDDRPKWVQALGNDLKAWERDFGAELVANYGTMLQFVVARPPTELDVAYALAVEHDIVAGSTLPPAGIQVRHYGADLIGANRWHLHDRP